jgi:hypothetical protein
VCLQQVDKADQAISNDRTFAKFRDESELIMVRALPAGGLVYVTGYARFFSAEASAGDRCDTTLFFNHWMVCKAIGVLNMRVVNRDSMKDLVRRLSALIRRDVVHTGGDAQAKFVTNIDPHFEGPRS